LFLFLIVLVCDNNHYCYKMLDSCVQWECHNICSGCGLAVRFNFASYSLCLIICFIEIFYLYQGNHGNCHESSPCHLPGYIPSKVPLLDPMACQQLENQLKKTNIYRYAQSFCRVSCTAYLYLC